jgi:hypothetical protein
MMEGEKMESYKKEFLKLKCFLLSKYELPLLFEETLGAFFLFFFFNIFSSSFSLFFSMLRLLSTWGFDGIR